MTNLKYMQDFIKIRKGTNPKIALKKSTKVIWEYILSESKDFKLQEGLVIHIEKLL